MAKVQLSALGNAITGRVGDLVYYVRNGVQCVRSVAVNPSNPNTARQQFIRGKMSDLSALYRTLSQVQKDLWQDNAVMTKDLKSGRGSFMRHNLRILDADHPALGCVYWPPKTPATPEYPLGFCVTPVDGTHFCITWSGPKDVCLFITGNYNVDYGSCQTWIHHWQFIETVRSDVGEIVFTHSFPSNYKLHFKIHSIDHHGRISPWSHPLTALVP